MTAILRHLPFREEADEVSCGLERVPIKPYQIIVWVSLTARPVVELPPTAPRLLALLDTGHNHNFSLQDRHLAQWAGLDAALPRVGRIREGGRDLPLHAANVWLHPNLRGKRDAFSGAPPLLLPLDQGIAVYPGGSSFPRLPLLGLRALVRNKLHVALDPERRVVHLRTSDWRARLAQWLLA